MELMRMSWKRRMAGRLLLAAAAIAVASVPSFTPAGARSFGQDRMITVATPSNERYPHGAVLARLNGDGGDASWVFTPDQPRAQRAPVVVFLHGFRATDPYTYGGWINHLVRRGNIVIFPVFETSQRTPPMEAMRNAISATRVAIDSLRREGPVAPDLDRVAFVGHSFGGGLSAQLAAAARQGGLPEPKAVMAVEPGWQGSPTDYPVQNLPRVPGGTYLLVVEGDRDQFEDSRQTRPILNETRQIPPDRKRMIRLRSEDRGRGLIGDHYAPLSPVEAYKLEETTRREDRRRRIVSNMIGVREGQIDDLDVRVLWPMFDSLMATAFNQGNMEQVVRSADPRMMSVAN